MKIYIKEDISTMKKRYLGLSLSIDFYDENDVITASGVEDDAGEFSLDWIPFGS